jgi:hypothetical protein
MAGVALGCRACIDLCNLVHLASCSGGFFREQMGGFYDLLRQKVTSLHWQLSCCSLLPALLAFLPDLLPLFSLLISNVAHSLRSSLCSCIAGCFWLVAQSAAACWCWFLVRWFFYPEDVGDNVLPKRRFTRDLHSTTSRKLACFTVKVVYASKGQYCGVYEPELSPHCGCVLQKSEGKVR